MASDPYRAPQAELFVPDHAQLPLAGIGDRFVATLIDHVLPLIAPFGYVAFAARLDPAAMRISDFFALCVAIAWIGLDLFLMGARGQSVGKLAVRIRVVRSDGSPVSIWRYFGLRALPILVIAPIPIVGWLIWTVDALFILGNRRRRCIHDFLADTIVVHVR